MAIPPIWRVKKNQIVEITYETRDLGHGRESGVIEGYWTGELDTWGKYTIRDINTAPTSKGSHLYLFADEIRDVREDITVETR